MQEEKELYLNKSENLKFESIGDYFDHINEIGKRNKLNAEQKLKEIHKAYHALGDTKGDVTVVSSIKFLKEEAFDQVTGRMLIDWPDKNGDWRRFNSTDK